MSCLKAGFPVRVSSEIMFKNRVKRHSSVCSATDTLQFKETSSRDFLGRNFDFQIKAPKVDYLNVQPSVCVSKALRWWEKCPQPNMVEIESAQQLVDSLSNAGGNLVILDFYSPGCGGCKTLHPKICQLAETNPNAIFLKINFEQHKAMCYALNVHVLPFFRFYKGADGRVCSFSCTNATIKKFKDAISKHGNEGCSLVPAKGLDESEVSTLASIGLISRKCIMEEGSAMVIA